MSFEFTLSDIVPASPEKIYAAWLDSAAHAAMTGSKAAQCSNALGGTAHGVGGLSLGPEPRAGARAAHRPILAHDQIRRRRAGFRD